MWMVVLSFVVCVGIPAAGAVCCWRRHDGSVLTFLTGAAAFFISQPLLRIPLLGLLKETSSWYALLPYTSLVCYYLFMALTAGIFEECARWLGFRFCRKGRVSWMEGLAYGLGHGGCEAAWMFVVQVLPLVKSGQAGAGLGIGALERLFAMMIQIGLSYVVLYGVREKKVRYLGLAVLLHGFVDFQLILAGTSIWLVEGILAVEGIAALYLVLRRRKSWDKNKSVNTWNGNAKGRNQL